MTDPASDSGTPERPRPQYGEYATPEEQRARIRQPDASRAIETGQSPDAPVAEPVRVPAPAPAPTTSTPARPAGRGALIDRIATIALLVYGLVNVISAVPQMIAFTPFAEIFAETLGMDASGFDLASGRLWGTIAGVVYALGWVATAVISWRRLARGRVTFWIPLVGGVVSVVVAGVLLSIALLGDPAVLQQFASAGR